MQEQTLTLTVTASPGIISALEQMLRLWPGVLPQPVRDSWRLTIEDAAPSAPAAAGTA